MESTKSNAYAVWKIKDFRSFLAGRFFLTFGIQMQAVIVGWQIYELTKDVLALGMIGLAEAIPFMSFAVFAGHIADRFNRKKIMIISTILYLLCATGLLIYTLKISTFYNQFGVIPIYAIIFISGFARSTFFTSQSALMAQLVPRELYANSTTWNSTFWHIAAVSGPAIGGLIYGFLRIKIAYLVVTIFVIASIFFFALLQSRPRPIKTVDESFKYSLTVGIRFVFKNQVVLGGMSLDMFAVLFGGITALLPVFSGEILHAGPQGLGFLRAAPAFGAVIMALILAHNPPLEKAGKNLLWAVTGFGVCIISFALSRNFYVSLFILALSGMFDNVSVIVRGTIMQLFTPDEMRGRVAAINSIFIGSSNEIGAFESGVAAKLMRVVPSVIFGGVMTLLVAGTAARFAPKLRKLNLAKMIGEK